MTTEQLTEEADRIAGLRNDPRSPAVVRRALLEPGGLSLRGYLRLEAAGSPLLSGLWPTLDPAAMAQAFCSAWEIVFPMRELPPAASLVDGIAQMRAEVARGFSTVMPMRLPRTPGAASTPEAHDGLGWVARVLGRLAALGWRPTEVLDLPMDVLFLLLAGISAADGAECSGEDYRERMKDEGGRMKGEGSAVPVGGEPKQEYPGKPKGTEDHGQKEEDE